MRPICWAVIVLMETLPAEIRRRAEQPNVIFMGARPSRVSHRRNSYAHLARHAAAVIATSPGKKLGQSAERRVDPHPVKRYHCLRAAERGCRRGQPAAT